MVTTTTQPGAYRALLNNTDGIVRQVVELHQPTNDQWQECRGCPEGDDPDYWVVWPCRTTQLIAEQVGVSLDEDDYTVDAEPTEPRMYAVDLSTGDMRGGPGPGTVQHWDRETFELQVHEYAPDSCDRCAELRNLGYPTT